MARRGVGRRGVGRRGGDRLVGLDVARFLALLAMMATHLLATRNDAGAPTWVAEVLSGRASALFALLAGVSLSLMSGGPRPVRGQDRVARTAGLLIRALALAVVGLALGEVDSGLAVILVNYAVLFALGVLVLGCSSRTLAACALASAMVAPVLLWWLRPHLPPRGFESPSLSSLEQPWQLAGEVLFTGYYPVLVWTAYLFAGMALGRMDLRRAGGRVLATLALVGGLVAVTAQVVSDRLLARAGTVQVLDPELWRAVGADDAVALEQLHLRIDAGMYGQTPVDGGWQWLLVSAPHSSTGFDLLRTGGTAVVVVALCLWGARLLGRRFERVLAVLAGAGAATLSLYTLHVLMTSEVLPPADGDRGTVLQYVVVVAVGALIALSGRRGPLESVVALAARLTERAVRGPSAPT